MHSIKRISDTMAQKRTPKMHEIYTRNYASRMEALHTILHLQVREQEDLA